MKRAVKEYLALYVVLLAPSLLISVISWQFYAPGRLFICDDSFGFDFFPPFAHPHRSFGDHYFVPAPQVYRIWSAFLFTAFLLPVCFLAMHRSVAGRGNENPENG